MINASNSEATSENVRKVGQFSFMIEDVLGKGNQATVYKGKHLQKNYQVAIKVIDAQTVSSGINKKLLQSEIKVLETLKDQAHILNLHQSIKTIDEVYIITQLCFGDMAQRSHKKITENQAWKYLRQIIKGYQHLYHNRIIHRDLKPSNLLLNKYGQIVLADFGFAISETQARKQNHYNIGSPEYMAPEALKNNQYSYQSDIWAIGMMFYEMLSSSNPWRNKTQKYIEGKLTKNYIERMLKTSSISSSAYQFLSSALTFDHANRMTPQQMFEFAIHRPQPSITKINKSIGIVLREQKSSNPQYSKFTSQRQMFAKTIELKKKSEKILSSKQSMNKTQNSHCKKVEFQKTTIKTADISEYLRFRVSACEVLFDILEKIRINTSIKNFIKRNCFQEANLVFVCYSNIIIRMLEKIINLNENNFLSIPENDFQSFIQSYDYDQIIVMTKKLIQKYSTHLLKEQWPKARDQNIIGALNATKNLISSISKKLKSYNLEELSLLKGLFRMVPLLENLHEQKIVKKKLDAFSMLTEKKGEKQGQSYLQVMKKAKSISTQKQE